MYPRDFLDSYWRPAIRDSVFVAMPFHAEFAPVWTEAIRPAIEAASVPALVAERVDATVLSGSIITKILDGIAHARLVFADISVMHDGPWQGQRNGNVMYEVGLAHACRHATEVLLVRSDAEVVNFDVAGIRIHAYDRGDLPGTRALFARLVKDALLEIDQSMGIQVQRAVDALDEHALAYMRSNGAGRGFHAAEVTNMADALFMVNKAAALARLQSLGILRCDPLHPSGKPAYYWTEFGRAVIASAVPAAERGAGAA
jgi:hypothetical protein